MRMTDLYAPYAPIAGSIASFLMRCRREGVTIEGALAAYDEYIGELAKSMRPAAAAAKNRELLCPRFSGETRAKTRISITHLLNLFGVSISISSPDIH